MSPSVCNEVLDSSIHCENPLRVLLISSSSGSAGGGELYLVGLAEGLHALGHEVHVGLSDHDRMDTLASMLFPWGTVHRFPYRNTYDWPFRGIASLFVGAHEGARQLINRLAPDVVHINKQNIEDGLDLIKAGIKARYPTLTTVHVTRSMTDLGARAGWLRDTVATRCLRRTESHLLATADACRGDLNRLVDTNQGFQKVHCVINGVAPAPVGGDRPVLRREWNSQDEDIVIGCVARIEHQKNPLFVVDLLDRLPSHVRLVWIGDGRLRGDLEACAKDRGVRDRLHLDGWRADARRRMAGFDMFSLPSLYEGFAFAVLEAMAAGLPCVASDVDGTREAVVDGESGFLCPVNDLETWTQRVTQLAEDAQLRKRFGATGRQRWKDRFSLDAMAEGTVEVYRRVIAHSRGKS